MGIPLQVTNEMKARLRELGLSDEEISQLTPSDAWNRLGGMPQPLLTAALTYAKMGWHVFPCGTDKAPLTEHGFKEATRDPTTIRQWWARHPNANIGVACGASNLVVLDLDTKHGEDAVGNWRKLCADLVISDAGALLQMTPSGGQHLLFANPHKWDVRNRAGTGSLAPGVEVRANGGYILVAPSQTNQGEYVWDVSTHPEDLEPAQLPQALVDLLRAGQKRDDVAAILTTVDEAADESEIPEGARNATLAGIAGSMRRRGLAPEEIAPALLAVNQRRCKPPLPDSEVLTIASSIGHKPAAITVADQVLDNRILETLRFGADDEGNAQAVNLIYGSRFLYCDTHGWLHYNGQHWDGQAGEATLDRAIVEVLTKRRLAAVQHDMESVVKATRPTAVNVRACKYLFQSIVTTDAARFDANPDVLNCQNGVLDLRTGDLYPHGPEQLFTYCIPVSYDYSADASVWEQALLAISDDNRALVDYLQTALGYSLTGHTWEECLFYLHGPTRSGKGTFTETVIAMLGGKPLSTEVDFGTFTAKRDGDTQNFDLAPLKPCRFVAAAETTRTTILNAAKIKQLTGGNDIYCAHKHRPHFSYRPQFKIWLASNYPPNADVDDDAVWYRIQVIDFPHSWAGHEDKRLKAELKELASLAGTLAWAVKGAIRWYNMGSAGLHVPKQIRDATDRARTELDYVGQWLEECVEIIDPATSTPRNHFLMNSSLYGSYDSWCRNNGVQPKHLRGLVLELKRKGLDAGQVRKISGMTYRGCYGVKFQAP